MGTTFVSKTTVIEADWLNMVDAVCSDVLLECTSAAQARTAIDTPQETQEITAQCRINGSWVPLVDQTAPLHASTHAAGQTDELDHDTLLNGTGNKHIDHTAVVLTAGSGLTGGGDLTISQTFAFSYLLEQNMSAGGFRITNLGAPSTALDAVNKSYADNLVIEAGANPWQGGVPDDSIYYSTGFVGIGTDSPLVDLDVRGDVAISAKLGIGMQPGTSALEVTGNVKSHDGHYLADGGSASQWSFAQLRTGASVWSGLGWAGNKGVDDNPGIWLAKPGQSLYQIQLVADGQDSWINIAQNFGIGLTNPSTKLHVNGAITGNTSITGASLVATGDVSGATATISGALAAGNTTINGDLTIQ